jgi:predicted transcriptional regulator
MIQFYWLQNKELFIVFLSAVEGLDHFAIRYNLIVLKKNNKDFHYYRG